MRSKQLAIVLGTVVVLTGMMVVMLALAPNAMAAVSVSGAQLLAPAQHLIQGRVIEGPCCVEPPTGTYIENVTVSLYCANNPYPDLGGYLRNDVTDSSGYYELPIYELGCEYYNVIETNLAGYSSTGASAPGGTKKTNDWLQFLPPLDGKDLTGAKFWDLGPATATPTLRRQLWHQPTLPRPDLPPLRPQTRQRLDLSMAGYKEPYW